MQKIISSAAARREGAQADDRHLLAAGRANMHRYPDSKDSDDWGSRSGLSRDEGRERVDYPLPAEQDIIREDQPKDGQAVHGEGRAEGSGAPQRRAEPKG